MIRTIFHRRPFNLNARSLYSQANADPELKLPKFSSLAVIITSNLLLQLSFFIVVSSSNEYAIHLGGTSVFSGIVIGIPTVFSGLIILPMLKFDKGKYTLPIHVSCASAIVGFVAFLNMFMIDAQRILTARHILYALAYPTNFLYLILIGRIVNGFAFSSFMYNKKYCSDARIVGIRRRTTLASWLVITQGLGLSLGPFLGGLLYKIGFKNSVFNGFTSPGWIMAGVWAIFWVFASRYYEDPEDEQPETVEMQVTNFEPKIGTSGHDMNTTGSVTPQTEAAAPLPPLKHHMSFLQWGVVFCMCWFAMSCWFILGAWEANLPVLGASLPVFHWSPFAAGNFIALGAICCFPFLLANLFVARRVEDRKLLAFGSALGSTGLVIFIASLATEKVSYGTLFVSWWSVALGFNLASTVTVSLLSKQLPAGWNGRSSIWIQYSTYAGRTGGAVWGGSGVKVGMKGYAGLEIGFVCFGALLFCILWRELKAKRG